MAEEALDPSDPDGSSLVAEALRAPMPDEDVVEEALDRLEDAFEVWRNGDRREGALRADSALALLPALSDWRPLARGEMLAAAGDTAGVREALADLDRDSELWSRWGWRALAQAHEEADDPAGAWVVARMAAEEEWRPDRRSGAWLAAGRFALAEGDSTLATDHFWLALEDGDGYAGARGAAQRLDRLGDEWDPSQEVRIGTALLAGGEWERGIRRVRPHLDTDVLSPGEALDLTLEVGRALHSLDRHDEARAVLSALVDEADDPSLEASATYWKGRASLELGAYVDAERLFREVAKLDPGSRFAEEGFRLLLEEAVDSGPDSRVESLLGDLLDAGVRSPAAELAVVRLGTTRYMEDDLEGAAGIFERYREASGRSAGRQQAAYWDALTRARAGQDPRDRFVEVREQDPLSFYGVAAGERVGAPVLPTDLEEGPSSVPGLDLELKNALLRLKVHRFVPMSGSFSFELDRLTEHFLGRGDGAYDFAEALIDNDLALHGIVVGREIHRREGEWNLRLLRIVHPLPYRDVIVREARSRGLDPFFVSGLIRQESMFDARIQSPAGAVGLMQLMPATAEQTARGLGLRYDPRTLEDPDTNIRLGTTFLATLVDRFDGRAEDALAAYNAGPTRMRNWQRRSIYGDRDVFMEHVPFRETRHYVKVVQQYARIYAALYGCGDFEPCPGLSYEEVASRSSYAGGPPDAALAR